MTVLCALALSTWLLGACGGRYQTIDDGGGDSSLSGAGSSQGGADGALSAGRGGFSGGGSSAGSAAGGACSLVKCATNIDCPAGWKPVTLPGACCPMCQPICQQACPAIACASGKHLETPAGVCCPVCVDDPGLSCTKGQQAYAQVRNELLTKYEFGCASDAECTVIAPVNLCEQGCQYAAVWYGAADNFTSNLSSQADRNCAACVHGPVPPCLPPTKPRCVANQCVLGPHPG